MKKFIQHLFMWVFAPISLALTLSSCDKNERTLIVPDASSIPLEEMAQIMSELPLEKEQLQEVYDAVSSSSTNGYDEEYMMTDLLSCPGAGVGDIGSKALSYRVGRASRPLGLAAAGECVAVHSNAALSPKTYAKPLREMLVEHLKQRSATKADGAAEVEAYLNSLAESDLQIYWPYSEQWDGESYPIVTFDPGNGAESNYGYVVKFDQSGAKVMETVVVDENTAMSRPVWVINRNDDARFTPITEIPELKSALGVSACAAESGLSTVKQGGAASTSEQKSLYIRSFRMNQHYDSWFGGASEFFIKCGAISGLRVASDEDLRLYRPEVTDFMVVVKRHQKGLSIPLDVLLVSDYTEQLDKLAFLIIEDDGGETKSWKCSMVIKYKSKSTGIELEIPYKDRDDIVWRGQLARSFLTEKQINEGNFAGVTVKFEYR